MPRPESGLRYVFESLVLLALAVLLVRSFAVEGYIISTGSMAPFLLGYHKQVVCPDCRFQFAVGVPVEEDHTTSGPVACPNCGQTQIDLEQVPRNEGDQLLVQKCSYLFRHPKRWEVVVFQNPSRPTQAYVKRVVGLPGEQIQVVAGDAWINGELVRKTLAEQRNTRIPICSQRHRPKDEVDQRWKADDGWQEHANGFEFANNSHHSRDSEDGASATRRDASGPLSPDAESPSKMKSSIGDKSLAWVNYRGTWPADDYAYNSLADRPPRYLVRDLMAVMQLELRRGRGEFTLAMNDGRQTFKVRLAAGDRELQLFVEGRDEPVQTAKLSGPLWRSPLLLEMSLFDRQLLVALGGETVFAQKLALRPDDDGVNKNRANSASPLRFGARDLQVTVRDLMLYRDVYYTRGDGRHAITEPYPLGVDEYFFLGDNSPVSLDSRSWVDAVVRDHMLLGKPFLVHLPSRPGRIKVGSAEWHIRVPDWGRIRYIR